MKKDYLNNFKATILINLVFVISNIFSLIPEIVYNGEPATDEIYDRKILLINACQSFKDWIPYLGILFFWHVKWKLDLLDYAYCAIFLFTCVVNTFDAFINPYRATEIDWIVIGIFWSVITFLKFINYRK